MADSTEPTKPNPVAFNPATMTARQLFDVADFARWLFDTSARTDIDWRDVRYTVEQHREQFLHAWRIK